MSEQLTKEQVALARTEPIEARPAAATLLGAFWLPVRSLWTRECKRFVRQTSRLIGVLASPLVFWLLLGFGLGGSFQNEATPVQGGYLEFFFPGTLVLVVLFTAIFSTISVIEDRREGFLQSVLVSPAPSSAITLGKILGGTTVAVVQGIVLLLLARPVGIPLPFGHLPLAILMLFVIAFGLTGFGLLLAWKMESSQGFHAIMNLLLMPMWLLSGAVFPLDGAPRILQWIMYLNPLTYGIVAFRHALYGGVTFGSAGISFTLAVWVAVLFGLATWAGSTLVAASRGRSGR